MNVFNQTGSSLTTFPVKKFLEDQSYLIKGIELKVSGNLKNDIKKGGSLNGIGTWK